MDGGMKREEERRKERVARLGEPREPRARACARASEQASKRGQSGACERCGLSRPLRDGALGLCVAILPGLVVSRRPVLLLPDTPVTGHSYTPILPRFYGHSSTVNHPQSFSHGSKFFRLRGHPTTIRSFALPRAPVPRAQVPAHNPTHHVAPTRPARTHATYAQPHACISTHTCSCLHAPAQARTQQVAHSPVHPHRRTQYATPTRQQQARPHARTALRCWTPHGRDCDATTPRSDDCFERAGAQPTRAHAHQRADDDVRAGNLSPFPWNRQGPTNEWVAQASERLAEGG